MTDTHSQLKFWSWHNLPVIRQTEAAECGVACLAMVASYHGHKLDLHTLRRRISVSLKGTNLRSLMVMADRLKLSGRALRLELEDLPKLVTPCILHWDLNHFVVLKGVKGKYLILHDPARGMHKIGLSEASKHFTGVALELNPAEGFEKKTETEKLPLAGFWRRTSGLKRSLVQAFLLAFILQLFGLATPFYTQIIVDEVLVKSDLNLLNVLALGFGLLILLQMLASVLNQYVGVYLGTQLNFQIVTNLFHHLLRLPHSWFEKRHIGDIVSRFGSTVPIQNAITTGLIAAVINIMTVFVAVTLLLVYSPLLTAIIFGFLMLYILLRAITYHPLRQRSLDQIIAKAKADSVFMESVRGILPVKLFGRESERENLWRNEWAESINYGIRVRHLNILLTTANAFLFGAENILVLYLGAKAVMGGALSLGMLMAFMAYKGRFESAAIALVDGFIAFRMLGLHLERLADIGLAEREEDENALDSSSMAAALPLKGEIEIRNLSFRYAESEPWVLQNVNLLIGAGEFIAITGPSGGGKTTLLKLILGLLEPNEGEVLVDGRPIGSWGLRSLRAQIGVVSQEDSLLSGSIAENISFFDPEMDMARIYDCARTAAVHEEIVAMPMGYESLIGDMGTVLSGGQKQRVLIARALYREPRLLFLDEGTANLDKAAEAHILKLLSTLHITRVSIAHRDEMIQAASRIFSVKNGTVKALQPRSS